MKRIVTDFNEVGFSRRMAEIANDIGALNTFSEKFSTLEVGAFTQEFLELLISSDRNAILEKAGEIMEQKLVNAGIPRSSNIVTDAVISIKNRLQNILGNAGIDLTHHTRQNIGFIQVDAGVFGYRGNIDEVKANVRRLYENAVESKDGLAFYEFHKDMAKGLQRFVTAMKIKPFEISRYLPHLFNFSGDEINPITTIDYDLLATSEKEKAA